jgi:hypothetical protein
MLVKKFLIQIETDIAYIFIYIIEATELIVIIIFQLIRNSHS